MAKTIPQLNATVNLSLANKFEVSQSDASNATSLYGTLQQINTDIVNPNAQLANISQVTGLTSELNEKLNLSGGTLTGSLIIDVASENVSILDPSNLSTMLEAVSLTKAAKPFPEMTQSNRDSIDVSGNPNGIGIYNNTTETYDYYDSNDWQKLLAIGHIIQGSNMSIVNNGDGTVTFNAGGGGTPGEQVSGSFTVNQNAISTTPLTSDFMAIAIDSTKFIPTRQNGMSVTAATIDGVMTPIITNTSSGGVRYGSISFDLSINPSFSNGQLYTFCITIQRDGGGIELTNYIANIAIPTITTAGSFKPISISSGLISLDTNDYAYLTVLCNASSEPFVAYNLNGRFIDTTIAGLPDTDALIQGSNNIYLSSNGNITLNIPNNKILDAMINSISLAKISGLGQGTWSPIYSSIPSGVAITTLSAFYLQQGDIVVFYLTIQVLITTDRLSFNFTLPITPNFSDQYGLSAGAISFVDTVNLGIGDGIVEEIISTTNPSAPVAITINSATNSGTKQISLTGMYKVTP